MRTMKRVAAVALSVVVLMTSGVSAKACLLYTSRCVAIIAGVVSIIVSVVLLFVWPVVFTALITVGQSIAKMGAVGAGIYAFLNRLLIPTGSVSYTHLDVYKRQLMMHAETVHTFVRKTAHFTEYAVLGLSLIHI